jgi:hypothetical protein
MPKFSKMALATLQEMRSTTLLTALSSIKAKDFSPTPAYDVLDNTSYVPDTNYALRFFSSRYIPELIDISKEPAEYYHSIGSMDPMKLIGILRHGILSKSAAEDRGLSIDANGLQCNGTDYVSVATTVGGCVYTIGACRSTDADRGAFHFAIERDKLTTSVRRNPEQDMPSERQIFQMVPRDAVKAIYLENTGLLDLEHPHITLGIGFWNMSRARARVRSYINFMAIEFEHHLSTDELTSIQETLDKMEAVSSDKHLEYFDQKKECEVHERAIDAALKKHLKLCYQKVISKDLITPYDILRHYDKDIPVYDFEGNEIHPLLAETAALGL